MTTYAAQTKSSPNRMMRAFILSAAVALGGCAVRPIVNTDTCNEWNETFFGIPELLEIFNGKHSAKSNELCSKGRTIGYSALFARDRDGSMNPASLVLWQKEYQKVIDQISVLTPDEATDLLKLKKFADFFITEGSKKQGKSPITSEMAMAMFQTKTTDPSLFTADGLFAPPPKPAAQKDKLCAGTGMFRRCTTPVTPPDAEPQ